MTHVVGVGYVPVRFATRTSERKWHIGGMPLRIAGCLLLAVGWAPSVSLANITANSTASLAQPALSSDGRHFAFASRGNIWIAPINGGAARLLSTHGSSESHPMYSPDGTRLIIQSARTGFSNIYVVTIATGEVTRLTFADADEIVDGWSADGRWVYFSSPVRSMPVAEPALRQYGIYRVSSAGGTPMPVCEESFLSVFQSASSPDGAKIAFLAKGGAPVQWWRNGHANGDTNELWLKTIDSGEYQRLLPGTAKHGWPMWSADGKWIYFVSDQGGTENLWRVPANGGPPALITHFSDGRVLWPSIDSLGDILFERAFEIWRYSAKSGRALKIQVTLPTRDRSPARRVAASQFDAMAVSADGTKMAVIARGHIFTTSLAEGGVLQRLTMTPGAESDLAWSPDGTRLAYACETGISQVICEYDLRSNRQRVLSRAGSFDGHPVYSPDGNWLVYTHGRSEMRMIKTVTAPGAVDRTIGEGRTLFSGALGATWLGVLRGGYPAWSPDGRWIAFSVIDRFAFSNIYVVEVQSGKARQVSFYADNQVGLISWSPDSSYLLFSSAQRSEDPALMRIDFPRTSYTNNEVPDVKSVLNPEEQIPPTGLSSYNDESRGEQSEVQKRIVKVPLGIPAFKPSISPNGQLLVFSSPNGEYENLYLWDLRGNKGAGSPRQITSDGASKTRFYFTPDSTGGWYLAGGKAFSIKFGADGASNVSIVADEEIDFELEKHTVFDEVWSAIDREFYASDMRGHDWRALRKKWAPLVAGTVTAEELTRDLNLMIGELDVSHSGIEPSTIPELRVGALGLEFDRAAYEDGKKLLISGLVPGGPAASAGSIKPGMAVTAVNGVRIIPQTNFSSLLVDQIGKQVQLTITDFHKTWSVSVRPIAVPDLAALRYRQWVQERCRYVDMLSGGKLSYVHVPDMGSSALTNLEWDLGSKSRSSDGVILDLRHNGGGFFSGRILDLLTRYEYLTHTARDMPPMASRGVLGQRSLLLPTILIVDESTVSDGENFAEGYRYLGLGSIVGVPTAGWNSYGTGKFLIDGSLLRIPTMRTQTLSGNDLEAHSRSVDVLVERMLGDESNGRDRQLEVAVRELLKQSSGRRDKNRR